MAVACVAEVADHQDQTHCRPQRLLGLRNSARNSALRPLEWRLRSTRPPFEARRAPVTDESAVERWSAVSGIVDQLSRKSLTQGTLRGTPRSPIRCVENGGALVIIASTFEASRWTRTLAGIAHSRLRSRHHQHTCYSVDSARPHLTLRHGHRSPGD